VVIAGFAGKIVTGSNCRETATETGKNNPRSLFVNIGYRLEMAKLKFYDRTDTAYDGTVAAYDRKKLLPAYK